VRLTVVAAANIVVLKLINNKTKYRGGTAPHSRCLMARWIHKLYMKRIIYYI
jgi:hypothetical protein